MGEQLIKSLRLSETVNYKIVGTDVTEQSKGLMEVDIPHIVPFANDPGYILQLLTLCAKYDVKAVFPGSEPELKAISDHYEAFIAAGIFLPINPREVLDICFDKFKTVTFLKENGFAYPKSQHVSAEADLGKIDFLPAVLKPSVGGSGSANIMIAQTQEELIVFGKYLLTIYNEYIVQEYVGTADHEYTIGVLIDMEGTLINSIGIRRNIIAGLGNKIKIKNRTGKRDLGSHLVVSSGISQGEVGKYEMVTRACERLALALGARSALNIQCRYYEGKVYVFEINPRYSGTTSLRAMAGYNEPDIMVRKYLLGEAITPNFDFEHCTIMRGLQEVIIAPIQ